MKSLVAENVEDDFWATRFGDGDIIDDNVVLATSPVVVDMTGTPSSSWGRFLQRGSDFATRSAAPVIQLCTTVWNCPLDMQGTWGSSFTGIFGVSEHHSTLENHMSNTQPPASAPLPATPPQYQAPVQQKKKSGVLGYIALTVAALGFIFAVIPGALIVGWILLPVGFILGIIALFVSRPIWTGIVAVVLSVVGTIVGLIVFFAVVAGAVSTAIGDTDVNVGASDDTSVTVESEAPAENSSAEVGTRGNPAPLGAPIDSTDWTVVVNSVTLNAADAILAANAFNDAPDAGTEYILVNYTVTYKGNEADGDIPAVVQLEYVTAGGNTVSSLDKLIVAPDDIDTLSALFNGASVTGNKAIQVPTPADGVLAITPGLFADKVFVAIN
jgi:hypothetical protein